MKSIHKLAYAALLFVSAFSIAPTLAAAQEARGSFTLTHDVRWQNADVTSGEYQFSLQPMGGASQLLVLRSTDGRGKGFMMVVSNTEEADSSDSARLFLVSRSGKSYVSAMKVPQSGVMLHFMVPPDAEKQIAAASPVAAASSAR